MGGLGIDLHTHDWQMMSPLGWWDAKVRLRCEVCGTDITLTNEVFQAFVLAGGVVRSSLENFKPKGEG